jgi:hypothetical protein
VRNRPLTFAASVFSDAALGEDSFRDGHKALDEEIGVAKRETRFHKGTESPPTLKSGVPNQHPTFPPTAVRFDAMTLPTSSNGPLEEWPVEVADGHAHYAAASL